MDTLSVIPVLLFSVVVHEVAHGWMALRLGDPTARDAGRLTLNPIPHLDMVGSIILPAILLLTGTSFFLAWAKPVPVNVANLRDPRRDDLIVSAVGPLSNLVLAFACALGCGLMLTVFGGPGDGTDDPFIRGFILNMLYAGIPINTGLALFNLLPIPPLDGSHILASMLPERAAAAYRQVGFAGILILLVVMRFDPVRIAFGAVHAALVAPYDALIRLFV